MSNEDEKKKQNIEVSIDTKRTEELARENERLKLEKEKKFDINEKKLEMFEQTKEPRYLSCKTREELTELTTALLRETVEKRKGSPSGSAYATPEQYGIKNEGLFSQKFDSENQKEMVDRILEYMHSEDPEKAREGKEAYEAFMRKWIMDKRQNPTRAEPNYSPNSVEALLDLDLEQKGTILTPRDKTKGDLGRLIERWANENPRRRLAKKQLENGENKQ